MKRTGSSMGPLVGWLALAGALGALPRATAIAATLSIAPNSAQAGGSVDMCVFLSGGQAQIAGIEVNILLDANCANAMRGSGNSADCTAASESGKQLSTVIGGPKCNNSPNCIKTLLFSFDNADPIPDGPLFCCAVTIPDSAPTGDCIFQLAQVRGSTGAGQPMLDIATQPGLLAISGSGSSGRSLGSGSGGALGSVPAVAAGGAVAAAPAAPAQPASGSQAAAPAASAPKSGMQPAGGTIATPDALAAAAATPGEAAPAAGGTPGGQPAAPQATAAAGTAPALPAGTPPPGTTGTPAPPADATPAAAETTPATAERPGGEPAAPLAAEVPATPTTSPVPTATPTRPLPTATATAARGWFSGCHMQR